MYMEFIYGNSGLIQDSAFFKKRGVDMGTPKKMPIELLPDGTMLIEDHVITLHDDQKRKLKKTLDAINSPIP